MKFDIRLLNCLWLMLPLLVWNIILGPRIMDARITSDLNSPKWLLISENVVRIFVFVLPLLLPLQLKDITSKAGLWIYIIGTLIYFASWLPFLFAPQSAWSNSPAGLLAPRLTPFLTFLGVALIGHSWTYGVIAALFIFLHTWHGIQNL
ncbi:MAG: hypothetical protein CVU43_06785 [Chloroflexi bacterium HGW-Chloroflexi-5]|nr:MAG: hypothetical protein CVU43_06785 [Chloroflexi bacterium HGW-Chloroflexi-5]